MKIKIKKKEPLQIIREHCPELLKGNVGITVGKDEVVIALLDLPIQTSEDLLSKLKKILPEYEITIE